MSVINENSTRSFNVINQFLDKDGIQLIWNKIFSSIDEELSKIKIINVLYDELKILRNNNKLMPGWKYCITDYKTTTVQSNTKAANNSFNIIVEALSENTLSENASADYREKNSNDYFFKNNANLGAWKLKYSLDNDTNRYAWADPNGKGVIYYMKDEWGNECPYDFKNIMMKRSNGYIGNNKSDITTLYTYEYQGDNKGPKYTYDSSPYFYTFSYRKLDNTIVDYSVIKNINESCAYNKILPRIESNSNKQSINIIYFVESEIDNTQWVSCTNNTFDYNCTHIVINGATSSLKLGPLNKWLDFGYCCSNITTGAQVDYMKFGNYCCDSLFKGYTCGILFTNKDKNNLKTFSGVNVNFNNYSINPLYITSDNNINNLYIACGINKGEETIEVETGDYFETKIARTSLSELKVYCDADFESVGKNNTEVYIVDDNITFTKNAIVNENNLILKGDNIYVNEQNKNLFIK